MLKGEKVKKYFEEHPECVKEIEGINFQHRPLTVDDIEYISFEGWEGQKGVFAWYYPYGVPHYTRIAE